MKMSVFVKLGKRQYDVGETALACSDLPQYDVIWFGEGGFALVVFTAKLPDTGKNVLNKLPATSNETKKSINFRAGQVTSSHD